MGFATGSGGLVLPLAVTFAIQTLGALTVYCAPVLAPVAAPSLSMPPSSVGYFVALTYLGAMFGSATAGDAVARFGPIRVSQIALALAFLGLACAATGILALAVIGALLVGLGYGPSTPASSAILLRATPPRLVALTFSIKQTGVPAGAGLAGIMVPALVPLLGWRGTALSIGLMALALAAAIGALRIRYDDARNPLIKPSLVSAITSVRFVLRDRALREMAIAGFVFGGVQITMVAYLVTFLTQSFAMSLSLAGLVLFVSQVSSVAGRIAWGAAADRLVSRRNMLGLLGLAMGLIAIATLVLEPHWPRWTVLVFASVFGATAVGWNGVWVAEVARLAAPGKVSDATGGALFFTYFGVVVTPGLFNQVLGLSNSYSMAYAVFGIPALCTGLALLLWRGGATKV